MYGGYYTRPGPYGYMENSMGYDQWGRPVYHEPQYYLEEQNWYKSRDVEAQQPPTGVVQASPSLEDALANFMQITGGVDRKSDNQVEQLSTGVPQASRSLQNELANFMGIMEESDKKREERAQQEVLENFMRSMEERRQRQEEKQAENEASLKRIEVLCAQINHSQNAQAQEKSSGITETAENKCHELHHQSISCRIESLSQQVHKFEEIRDLQPETIIESEVAVVNNFEDHVTKLPVSNEIRSAVESHDITVETKVVELSCGDVSEMGKLNAASMELRLNEGEIEEGVMIESREVEESLEEVQKARLKQLEVDQTVNLLGIATSWALSPILANHTAIMEELYANLMLSKLNQSNTPTKFLEQIENVVRIGLDELEEWMKMCRVVLKSIGAKPDEDHRVLKEEKKTKPPKMVIKCREGKEFRRGSKAAKRMDYPPPFRDRLKL